MNRTESKPTKSFTSPSSVKTGHRTDIAMIQNLIKFSSYIRKFRRERLQSHIWLTASTNMKYLRISSYIGKLFLIYDFATATFWISLYKRKIQFSFLPFFPSWFYLYLWEWDGSLRGGLDELGLARPERHVTHPVLHQHQVPAIRVLYTAPLSLLSSYTQQAIKVKEWLGRKIYFKKYVKWVVPVP